MSSDLSIFAARLREFISICADEPAFGSSDSDPALQAHSDAEFDGMALVLFALQFNHNAAYRKFCEARGVFPDAIAHWTQIPAVPTAAFKELELTCLSPEERTTVFHSSGTTAHQPSRHFHSTESLAVYEASLRPWFYRHVVPDLRPEYSALILAPTPAEAPHSSLVHMLDTVWNSVFRRSGSGFAAGVSPDGGWLLDLEKILAALRSSIKQQQPLVLPGTAFSFVQLLDHLAGRGLRFELPPGSRVMETGGYKGRSRALPKAELHALITERLGVPPAMIVSEYGMSELSSQAYDQKVSSFEFRVSSSSAAPTRNPKPETRNFHFPPWARAQIISPEPGTDVAEGEMGLIRVFDLANVFSVMAVQTEDLAIRRGDGFELIGRAEFAEARGCSLMSDERQFVNHKS